MKSILKYVLEGLVAGGVVWLATGRFMYGAALFVIAPLGMWIAESIYKKNKK